MYVQKSSSSQSDSFYNKLCVREKAANLNKQGKLHQTQIQTKPFQA